MVVHPRVATISRSVRLPAECTCPTAGTAISAARSRNSSTRMGTAMPSSGLRSTDRRHQDQSQDVDVAARVVTVNDGLNIVAPDLTVIIPTRNERDNVEPLLERLTAALGATAAEILFVDDSDDDTPDEIARVGRPLTTSVRLLHRGPDEREGGLSTAVVSGMRAARAPWALVMDAALQPPPEIDPQLFGTARRLPVDLVVGSRYAGHGSSTGLDGGARRGSSRFATRVAKVAFPRR